MKKTLSILVIVIIVLVISMTSVLATTNFTVSLSASTTTVVQGATVNVTVSLKNFTPNETGINSMKLTIGYDNTVFNTLASTDLTPTGGWGAMSFDPTSGQVTLTNSTFMSTDHDMLTIKFTAKSSALVGSTVVTIKNVDGSDGISDILAADQTISLNVQAAVVVTPPPVINNVIPPVDNNVILNVNNNVASANNNVAGDNPSTGVEDYTVPAIIGVSTLAMIGYIRYRKIRY